MRSRRIAPIAILGLALAACSSVATPAPTAAPSVGQAATPTSSAAPPASVAGGSLTIYAAASLKAALGKAKAAYEASYPGTTLTISTDSSSALETKIEQGAPADVFLSADTTTPQKLIDKGLAGGELTKFAGNLLTVIVPTANPAHVRTPADLAEPGVKIIAAGDAVPITRYATQLVTNLVGQAGYPDQFASRYAINIVSKEDNVAGVVSKIELGEGDAGIVYVTDAKASSKVTTIEVPLTANVPATYGGVTLKASKNAAAASAFLGWLAGRDGQAILATFGFLAPS
jgi:molybdate transport system substrate-binding protein